jgi:hypothetical protein
MEGRQAAIRKKPDACQDQQDTQHELGTTLTIHSAFSLKQQFILDTMIAETR